MNSIKGTQFSAPEDYSSKQPSIGYPFSTTNVNINTDAVYKQYLDPKKTYYATKKDDKLVPTSVNEIQIEQGQLVFLSTDEDSSTKRGGFSSFTGVFTNVDRKTVSKLKCLGFSMLNYDPTQMAMKSWNKKISVAPSGYGGFKPSFTPDNTKAREFAAGPGDYLCFDVPTEEEQIKQKISGKGIRPIIRRENVFDKSRRIIQDCAKDYFVDPELLMEAATSRSNISEDSNKSSNLLNLEDQNAKRKYLPEDIRGDLAKDLVQSFSRYTISLLTTLAKSGAILIMPDFDSIPDENKKDLKDIYRKVQDFTTYCTHQDGGIKRDLIKSAFNLEKNITMRKELHQEFQLINDETKRSYYECVDALMAKMAFRLGVLMEDEDKTKRNKMINPYLIKDVVYSIFWPHIKEEKEKLINHYMSHPDPKYNAEVEDSLLSPFLYDITNVNSKRKSLPDDELDGIIHEKDLKNLMYKQISSRASSDLWATMAGVQQEINRTRIGVSLSAYNQNTPYPIAMWNK
jgi:hypothetical protein